MPPRTQNDAPDADRPGLTAEAVHAMLAGFDTRVPSVEELREFYADDVVFKDPLQEIHGLAAFREMNDRLLKKLHWMQIEMQQSAQTGNTILFTFRMDLQPTPRAPKLHVEGTTHIQLDDRGKIILHRDYWDLAGALADMVPGFRTVYRRFTRLLA